MRFHGALFLHVGVVGVHKWAGGLREAGTGHTLSREARERLQSVKEACIPLKCIYSPNTFFAVLNTALASTEERKDTAPALRSCFIGFALIKHKDYKFVKL